MKILSIETSCDDTGIAVLKASNTGRFKVLANIVSSQTEVHQQYGGVYPMMAKRMHQKNSVPVLEKSLATAGLLIKKNQKISKIQLKTLDKILEREPELKKDLITFFETYQKPKINNISITNGPGLEPCLWVGVNLAKALSYFWDIPLIPVNHIEGHILVNILEHKKIKFPAIALVVSGGHTQIVLVKKIGSYKILGETRDDAAGECFDKCAKLLGLGYPGGQIVSELAKKSKNRTIKLPRPMINTKDYDFSFSGLKTAVLYADRKVTNKNQEYIQDMSAEVQQSIIDVLIKKTIKAIEDYGAKSLILGGGVSANQELRKQFASALKQLNGVEPFAPDYKLSTDNGLMIAIAGFYNRKKTKNWKLLKADGNLRIGK